MMHCTKCNAKLDTHKGYVFCPHCGETLKKDKPSDKNSTIGCIIIVAIIFAIGLCFLGGSDKEKETEIVLKQTTEEHISVNNSKTDQAILGAPAENFKKVYGKLNDKYSNKEMQVYKFTYPVIDIQCNFSNLEKVQAIHIDLRKYDKNTHKLIKPEVFPVQSIQEINEIIAKHIPSDSILIEEKTFKEVSLTPPTSRHKTLRLYKSKWLSKNLIPFETLPDYDRSDFLPDGFFNVKIDKLERGYLEIYLGYGSNEWDFVPSTWENIKSID